MPVQDSGMASVQILVTREQLQERATRVWRRLGRQCKVCETGAASVPADDDGSCNVARTLALPVEAELHERAAQKLPGALRASILMPDVYV